MPAVLVVDDSSVDRLLAGRLLSRGPDMQVAYAENGRVALDSIRLSQPDLVLCDLQMPEMNGLDLVEAVRRDHPGIPVILMTARGSETIATEALRRGAAGYVPKGSLATHLEETVVRVLSAVNADRQHTRLMHSLVSDDAHFQFRNDPELFDPLVAHLQESLRCLPLGDEAERMRVGIAVRKALRIAHYHGNLDIPVDGAFTDEEFEALARERRGRSPWNERALDIHFRISAHEFTVTIEYQGSPIAVDRLPSNLEAEAVDRQWLSRFVLLPAVMDEVIYEPRGSRLLLLKKAIPLDSCDTELEIE